ncbi:MAG: hypothetical protein AAGF83_15380 [Cyanobacteria bacterium P01_G01_bin.67]
MSNRFLIKSVMSVAIALSIQSGMAAQPKPANSSTSEQAALGNLREQLASEWSDAVVTHNLESPFTTNEIEFSPDGQLLAVLGASQIAIWDLNQGKIQRILPGHHATEMDMEIAPTAIAISPDSRFLATGTWSQGLLNPDWAIVVRDIATGEKVLELAKSEGCRQLLFDPAGEIIYSACGLGVTAWSFPEGKQLFSFALEHPVEAIALSPDGQVMATVDANVSGGQQQEQSNQIQLWQLESDQASLLSTLAGHENDIARLEFTANGKQLVSSSYDGKINVWNWQQGTTNRQTNNLHSNNGVFSLSANSQVIAGSFHSETMINLNTGLPLINLSRIPPRKKSQIIAFSPQEQLFARVENLPDANKSVVKLWQVGSSPRETQTSRRDNYRTIPLAEYWSQQEKSAAFAMETNKPRSIGQDIQAIALKGLGFTEIADLEVAAKAQSNRLEVQSEYPQDNLALVTITQSKLSDDSVEGYRYLLEFAPYGEQEEQKWQLVWAGKQFRCWTGRGHQEWSTDLCH